MLALGVAHSVGPSGSLRDPWLVSSTDRPSGVLSLGATGGFPSGVLSLGTTGGLFNLPCRAWGDFAPVPALWDMGSFWSALLTGYLFLLFPLEPKEEESPPEPTGKDTPGGL